MNDDTYSAEVEVSMSEGAYRQLSGLAEQDRLERAQQIAKRSGHNKAARRRRAREAARAARLGDRSAVVHRDQIRTLQHGVDRATRRAHGLR